MYFRLYSSCYNKLTINSIYFKKLGDFKLIFCTTSRFRWGLHKALANQLKWLTLLNMLIMYDDEYFSYFSIER